MLAVVAGIVLIIIIALIV